LRPLWHRLGAGLLALVVGPAAAIAIEPPAAAVLTGETSLAPPPEADPRWQSVPLPDARAASLAWYRVEFDVPAAPREARAWMVYLPYLYGGGRLWLNGEPVASMLESSDELRVRWNRPHLLPLPAALLRDGRNVLHLRVAAAHQPSGTMLPQLVVGSQDELQPMFERRYFFVRTVPLVTVVIALAAALAVGFVWWRRPFEALYGLAGLSALFWGLRTWIFVVDTLPSAWWPWWRLVNHASNGGFVVVLCLFGLYLARWQRRPYTIALAAYAVLGPLLFLALGMGETAERVVGLWWSGGLVPIGISSVVIACAAAWRRRKTGIVLIAATMLLALVTGIHDYLIAWRSPLIEAIAPGWAGQRILLLHYGADVLLATLGTLLIARFLRSLSRVEEANRTLEARVAEREREIAANYEHIALLQREQAATDERQRIMSDLHDGLGSQLFISLSRAERGALPAEAVADTLRGSIDEMRIAIEALASEEQDFRTAFGNFRFRWDARLREAGLVPQWHLDVPDEVLRLPPHDALQLLRIVQEALTNVLKHAQARQVVVRLRQHADRLEFVVEDDGRGLPAEAARAGGRGLANMRRRAEKLGARLMIEPGERGTRVRLELAIAIA
jgi:hypothetical protein